MTTLTQPPSTKKPLGLGLVALIVGILAFLFGLVPVFGALVGIAAIVLGILTLRKKQTKGMAIAGIVLGGIAVLASIGMTFGVAAATNNASDDKQSTVVSESAAPKSLETKTSKPVATKAPKPVETKAPAPVETKAPAPAPAPVEPAAPEVSAEFKSALTKAGSYSKMMHMSKAGLYGQLTSEYGEKFSAEAAQYAVDNVNADWNANALEKAKSYQDQMAMSPDAIRDQLTSEYGEQFTAEEADFALLHLND